MFFFKKQFFLVICFFVILVQNVECSRKKKTQTKESEADGPDEMDIISDSDTQDAADPDIKIADGSISETNNENPEIIDTSSDGGESDDSTRVEVTDDAENDEPDESKTEPEDTSLDGGDDSEDGDPEHTDDESEHTDDVSQHTDDDPEHTDDDSQHTDDDSEHTDHDDDDSEHTNDDDSDEDGDSEHTDHNDDDPEHTDDDSEHTDDDSENTDDDDDDDSQHDDDDSEHTDDDSEHTDHDDDDSENTDDDDDDDDDSQHADDDPENTDDDDDGDYSEHSDEDNDSDHTDEEDDEDSDDGSGEDHSDEDHNDGSGDYDESSVESSEEEDDDSHEIIRDFSGYTTCEALKIAFDDIEHALTALTQDCICSAAKISLFFKLKNLQHEKSEYCEHNDHSAMLDIIKIVQDIDNVLCNITEKEPHCFDLAYSALDAFAFSIAIPEYMNSKLTTSIDDSSGSVEDDEGEVFDSSGEHTSGEDSSIFTSPYDDTSNPDFPVDPETAQHMKEEAEEKWNDALDAAYNAKSELDDLKERSRDLRAQMASAAMLDNVDLLSEIEEEISAMEADIKAAERKAEAAQQAADEAFEKKQDAERAYEKTIFS